MVSTLSSMTTRQRDDLWARHHAEWRDTAQIASQWQEATRMDPRLLNYSVIGHWWETLAKTDITLLITREYEHLVMALSTSVQGPQISYLPLPHPSGLTFDPKRGIVHIASTRNPNQIYQYEVASQTLRRKDIKVFGKRQRILLPKRSQFYPGCLYLHDLAMIDGILHGNAVGLNAIVRLSDSSDWKTVWWPQAIETKQGPEFSRNHIQLNSIAAGPDLKHSFFSASADRMTSKRPGNPDFPVDHRGVIFSGATREPIVRGLTRPHSARLHQKQLWVDNSGYGEVGIAEQGHFKPVVRLPGWTRGLCFKGSIAFVGTSQVIPRFRNYAPGLEINNSHCGVHALDIHTGKVLGSLYWPYGNQIFAIEVLPRRFATALPFSLKRSEQNFSPSLFYAYTHTSKETSR